jgi:hypothetical protein
MGTEFCFEAERKFIKYCLDENVKVEIYIKTHVSYIFEPTNIYLSYIQTEESNWWSSSRVISED